MVSKADQTFGSRDEQKGCPSPPVSSNSRSRSPDSSNRRRRFWLKVEARLLIEVQAHEPPQGHIALQLHDRLALACGSPILHPAEIETTRDPEPAARRSPTNLGFAGRRRSTVGRSRRVSRLSAATSR